MMSTGCNYNKLKTNLRLAVNRLKLLEKKKTELAQKSRKEIADYLANGKIERSRIRVEHIIREDYLVEAMELVEIYCDLLLARYGLVQQMKTLDEGLAEAVSSLLWAAPRLQADVAELKIIADQLAIKYGKPYAQAARDNSLHTVNEKLMHKLSVQAPPKILVEKYLIEIAKSHNVPYEPDAEILAEEETATEVVPNFPLIDFGDDAKPPEPGFISGLPSSDKIYPGIQYPQPDLPKPFNYPAPNVAAKGGSVPPPFPSVPPSGPYPGPTSKSEIGFNVDTPAPPYESVCGNETKNPTIPVSVPSSAPMPGPRTKFPVDTLPELPSVPNTILPDLNENSEDGNEVDFDDLVKRFEELKKRK